MSEQKTVDISIRGVPRELWERVQRAARGEHGGILKLSATQMTILLLSEALDAREREGRNSGKIEDHIEALAPAA